MSIIKTYTHPLYNKYGYNMEKNAIIHIPTMNIVKQNCHKNGYCMNTVSSDFSQKSIMSHRFIWECCNDLIPDGYEIDHINKLKTDNQITNLRCVTLAENRKNRDHTNVLLFGKIAHQLRRFIKAISEDTNDFNCFRSKNQCAKYYGISPAMVYLICENKNNVKRANTNKGKMRFEYIDDKDISNFILIPDHRIGKTYNKNKTI